VLIFEKTDDILLTESCAFTTRKGGANMSYAKLRGKIREVFGANRAFAKAMGMNHSSLSFKLNNKAPWKREEIELACKSLGIPIEEVHLYFFAK
jgi:hypothetical protein